ncbi:MAG: phosphodiester glycosidase family protein [Gemmobacter sp.]|uniref:phosphodiester glycosidase family protein n=1 Tax=Gemmobacter sp. TaxID=1898957 RepID=UPI00391BA334
MTTRARLALALLAVLSPGTGHAACREVTHDRQAHIVCEVTAGQDVRLFLNGPDGALLGSFGRIDAMLAAEGRKLAFAMNAGMYHRDRRPVGLFIENGQQIAPLVTAAGPGNFGMRPNGVFCIRNDGRFTIQESRAWAEAAQGCRYATQSGPMLVIDGALHPRFLPDSASRYVRNGVGVSADGTRAMFAMSRGRVSFHEFARLFRDGLGLAQALYFDGNISRLYAPDLGRNDFGFPMGPVVGLVTE